MPAITTQQYDLFIVTGPTAVGKTAVAVELARQLGTEIISADSMQVYRHLSIGTAKPTSEELHGIPYHLIDHVNPDEQYNAARFVQDVEPLIARLQSENKIPIVSGGTAMYLRCLLHGMFEENSKDDKVRQDLEKRLAREGLPSLFAELSRVDPDATHIRPGDRQRILRALEVYQVTGHPITRFQTQFEQKPRYECATIILMRPRADLYAMINQRVDAMIQNGLLEEVRNYLASGYSMKNPAVSALGYADMIRHLHGEISLPAAVESMKQKTRNYAKRQETWFRSMQDAIRIDVTGMEPAAVCARIQSMLARA